MYTIVGGRHSGKTIELIKESARTGTYIMAANKERARYLFDFAKKLGIDIPYPVTPEEYFRNRFDGSIIRKKGIYVDDADDVLQKIFGEIPIRAVSITRNPGQWYEIDQEESRYPEVLWPVENPFMTKKEELDMLNRGPEKEEE